MDIDVCCFGRVLAYRVPSECVRVVIEPPREDTYTAIQTFKVVWGFDKDGRQLQGKFIMDLGHVMS
jgi:hypothetical protein